MGITENKTANSFDTSNKSAAGKVPFFQPKVTINAQGDEYEQEADSMADKVMRMPANDQPFFSPKPLSIFRLQRKCKECEEEEKLQRKEANAEATFADASTEKYISSLNGKGKSLTQQERSFFEPRFGYDFSDVQLHTNNEASQSAKDVNALAYTHGNNIVFGSGQYQPNTDSSKKLMAHELTHVVQQSTSLQPKKIQRKKNYGHDLKSARFAGDPVLEECYDGKHLMKKHETGKAVKKVQQALIDAGYTLPKFGVDGNFGNETATAVSEFKKDRLIAPSDGIVGPKTIAALDSLFSPSPPSPTSLESKKIPSNIDIKTKENAEVAQDGKTKNPKLEIEPKELTEVKHQNKEEEKESPFQFTAAVGIQNIWFTQFRGPKQDTGPCDQGLLQIGGKWNWKGIPIGDKLTLFSEPELDTSLMGAAFCQKLPGVTLQDNILKFEITKKIWELSLVGVFGLQDDWLKNWSDKPLTGMVGSQLDWHPWGDKDTRWYSNIKFTINISAIWNSQPEGTKDSLGVAGTASVGIELP